MRDFDSKKFQFTQNLKSHLSSLINCPLNQLLFSFRILGLHQTKPTIMEPQTQDTQLFQLQVDASTSNSLRSAASWGKILGILGIIFGVLFIIIGIMVRSAMTTALNEYNDYPGYRGSTSGMASFGMAIYIVMGIMTIIGSIFVLNFGNKAAAALRTNDNIMLGSSLNNLRNYFAFWGVLMIIGLLLTIIGMAGGAMTSF